MSEVSAKQFPDSYREIYYNDEHRQMSWWHGTIWMLEAECHVCGNKTVVMDADPEQGGFGTPQCQECIDRKFAEFAERLGAVNAAAENGAGL